MKLIIAAIVLYLVYMTFSSSSDERYDDGYSDGYATGYNTTCSIRTTLIEGDWNNDSYKKGYQNGYAAGSRVCKALD